jgi:signal transduction histidine kinase
VGDGVIVATIAFGCTLEVWAPGTFGSTHMTGPRAAVYVSYVVALSALVFRRRFPLACAIVVATALAAEWLAFGSPEGFGVFAIPIVAGYAVGANADRRRALVGLGALAIMAVVWTARDPTLAGAQAHVNNLGWLSPVLIGWLVGSYLREVRARADQAVRERDDRAAAAVASERARIARELHDIVAHNVSVMVVQAEAADEMLDHTDPGRAREPVQQIQATGRAALTDMRRLLGILRESDAQPDLGPQPGIANLDLLLTGVREAGLPVELEIAGEQVPLPPGVDLSAYRIVQEALTNTLKYAGAAHAWVRLGFVPGALELEVLDDGDGAASASPTGGGHGLVGMSERVALFGGELEAGPVPEGGYRVRARLPIRDGV